MVKMEDAVIARFEHSGEKFELLVDPNLAMDLKNGKEVNFIFTGGGGWEQLDLTLESYFGVWR